MINGWMAISQSLSHGLSISSYVSEDNAARMTCSSPISATWSLLSCKRWRVVVGGDVTKLWWKMRRNWLIAANKSKPWQKRAATTAPVCSQATRLPNATSAFKMKFYLKTTREVVREAFVMSSVETQCRPRHLLGIVIEDNGSPVD